MRRLGIVQQTTKTFADHFRKEVLPPFLTEVKQQESTDLTALESPVLLDRLEHWIQRTLYEFARDSLKPTVLAAVAMDGLQRGLAVTAGPEKAAAQAGELLLGVHPDPDADVAAGVKELASGRLDRTTFLERFGHRGSQEMELSQPRWSEDPEAVDRLARSGQHHAPASAGASEKPTLPTALDETLQAARTYLGLRETAKHQLLRGYALIRRILLEIDRRHRLQGGVFFLTLEELPRLGQGEDLSAIINQRRRRRSLLLSLEVPQVLFSDDLDAIGRPVHTEGADVLRGVALSAGVAEGPALVVEEPTAEVPANPYILVCPSTDPAWVPLFAHARALVMETGGVLSHGAIVAREFGLPAVAGIPDVQRRLRSGQWLRVDGASGTVTLLPDRTP
jgi:pyruvate,water dikinase